MYNDCFDPLHNDADIAIQFQSFYFQSVLFITAVQDVAFRGLKHLKAAIQKFVEISGSQVTELKLCVFPLLPVVRNFTPPHPPEVISVMYMEMVDMVYDYFPNLQHLKLLFLVTVPGKRMPEVPDFQSKLDESEVKQLRNLRTVTIDVNALHMDLGPVILENGDGEEIHVLGDNDNDDDDPPDPEVGEGLESLMVSNFVKTLLISAVHLESISSQNPYMVPEQELHRYLLRSLPLISPSPYLNEINMRLKMTDVNLHYLCCTVDFPNLSKLILEIDTSTVTRSRLKVLFNHFRSSVRNMDLTFTRQTSKNFGQLPWEVSMDNLASLTLKDYRGGYNWKKFPALEKLTLNNCSMQGFASSWISCYPRGYMLDNCSCPSTSNGKERKLSSSCMCAPHCLTNLKIVRGPMERTRDFCTVFEDVVPYCFKFLSSLSLVNVPPSVLSGIFQECGNLKRLEIVKCSPDDLDDEILCGLRDSLLRKLCPVDPLDLDYYTDGDNDNEGQEESIKKLVAFAKKRGKQSVREKAYIGNLKGNLSILNFDSIY